MDYCKVTAIFRSEVLEKVEHRLQELGVPGISVTRVTGYGEYADFYNREGLTRHVRVEIFTAAARAEPIAQAIMAAAHSGLPEDGLVAVLPVARLYRIRRRAEVRPEEL